MSGALSPTAARRRVRTRVRGAVQGVGFRPYVHRLAAELALDGFVLNDAQGVLLEVEGSAAAIEQFLARLAAQAPPLARIERVESSRRVPTGASGFAILPSTDGGPARAAVAADAATCAECLRELFDPGDRRYRYPFLNCTDCGPRLTIVRSVPYDRARTTMAAFQMCTRCRCEYEDPQDRRHHAQPIACPACGPSLRLAGAGAAARGLLGEPARDPAAAAAAALRAGAIVAIKGIGGFHLACRADDEAAVSELRARKGRGEKPFALMAADTAAARELVDLGPGELALLTGPQRPIVLARRRAGAAVAPAVAPGLQELGVMLPYSPLHHLLLADCGAALVMTSGNAAEHPIAYEDEDALERLGPVADLVLLHDRPIQTPVEDSLARVAGGRATLLRRARGYTPQAIRLSPGARRPILATGAELKSTFCLARGESAWVSQHIGDLRELRALRSFIDGVARFEELFGVRPELVAHDLHPDYLSTRYALERDEVELCPVQHHHAHLAACLAEHGERGPVVGAVFDGSGLGEDGTAWGGELLLGGLESFQRVGHLRAVRLPGGDRAAREPWRMACSWLTSADPEDPLPPLPARLAHTVTADAWEAVARLSRSDLAPPTTSVGRLFDAVAAICGLRARITYEGQAAIELEGAAEMRARGEYPIAVAAVDGMLGARPAAGAQPGSIRALLGDRGGTVAARFHRGLARATALACERAARERGLDTVVLGGGVFHNRLLLELTVTQLERAGLRGFTRRGFRRGTAG